MVCAEGGGAPCLERENAFIFACMSEFSPLARLGSRPGLLAAFVGPRGADEGLIAEAIYPVCEVKDGGLETDSGELWEALGEEAGCISSGLLEISGEGGCWGIALSMVTKDVRLQRCAVVVFHRSTCECGREVGTGRGTATGERGVLGKYERE